MDYRAAKSVGVKINFHPTICFSVNREANHLRHVKSGDSLPIHENRATAYLLHPRIECGSSEAPRNMYRVI